MSKLTNLTPSIRLSIKNPDSESGSVFGRGIADLCLGVREKGGRRRRRETACAAAFGAETSRSTRLAPLHGSSTPIWKAGEQSRRNSTVRRPHDGSPRPAGAQYPAKSTVVQTPRRRDCDMESTRSARCFASASTSTGRVPSFLPGQPNRSFPDTRSLPETNLSLHVGGIK